MTQFFCEIYGYIKGKTTSFSPLLLLLLDLVSGMGKIRIRDKHSGSATLHRVVFEKLLKCSRQHLQKYRRLGANPINEKPFARDLDRLSLQGSVPSANSLPHCLFTLINMTTHFVVNYTRIPVTVLAQQFTSFGEQYVYLLHKPEVLVRTSLILNHHIPHSQF